MASAESSVTHLASVIKQLSSSDDAKSREHEKDKIQQDLKNADEKLAELVEANQDHLKKTIQSFGSVVSRVKSSRSRIKTLHEKLSRCRTLLHCNRDDLKIHWQEGLECTEKLNLLDKIEKAVQVPEQLERYISKKHFLHASELLVETVKNLDEPLKNVEALRDLKASLHSRKAVLHETIIDELNKQIYTETQKQPKKTAASDSSTAAFKRIVTHTKSYLTDSQESEWEPGGLIAMDNFKDRCVPIFREVIENEEIPFYTDKELLEDLQQDPEENPPLFIFLMVKALANLEKIPEAMEAFKGRTKRDMMMIIRRASDQVAKKAIEAGDVVAMEEMASQVNPQVLLDLLEVTFTKFRCIALNHSILLAALEQAKEQMPGTKRDELVLYSKEDIWSKIQAAIKDMLLPYLDIQNIATPQQALTSFGNTNSAVAQFFTAKKKLISTSTKPKQFQLFKFECSSSAEALLSYLREQDIASSEKGTSQDVDVKNQLPEDTYADFIVWNAPQLLCKPQANNITSIFIPVMNFINEIDQKTSSTLGSTGVLHSFVNDFVRKVYLDQILFEVSEKASAVTKGHDALRNLCDSNTLKSMHLFRPLLKSTIVIDRITNDLLALMLKLPDYSNNFLDIIIRTLTEYYDTCNNSFKGLVFREGDGKASRVISANWVRDEDISRLLMSLPNWMNLHDRNRSKEDEVEDDASIKARQDKENGTSQDVDVKYQEASLLIGNLEKLDIEKNQVILDTLDLKALANLQESLVRLSSLNISSYFKQMCDVLLEKGTSQDVDVENQEWLSENLRHIVVDITAQTTSIKVSGIDEVDLLSRKLQSLSEENLSSLSDLCDQFRDLADSCLLLLHLEIRCHCFYFLGKATRESSFIVHMDCIEVDVQIPQLVKDLKDIEDVCSIALAPYKLRHLFDGLGYLIAYILISSTSYIKKINRNGVKKMCQNIFTIQQELANITSRREVNLDLARQYFELLFLTPDEILNLIHEQGARFKEQNYANAIELLSRSEIPFDENLWKIRRNKLSQILKEVETKN